MMPPPFPVGLILILAISIASAFSMAGVIDIATGHAKRGFKTIGQANLLMGLIWIIVAWATFQYRHPSAGGGAFLRYFPEVVQFRTVPNL